MKTDAELRDDVLAEIEWDPAVQDGQIGVTAHLGAITLSGVVGSYLQKQAVLRAAKRVHGVTAIADEMEVAWVHEREGMSDTDIAAEVQHALVSRLNIPKESVRAVVDMGRVTLDGEVHFPIQRSAAEDAVVSLRGVRSVSNLIRVTPLAPTTPTTVKMKIEAAFERHARIDASRINVHVDGDTVTLLGAVPTYLERESAVEAAEAAPGVREVIDELTVNPALR
jgi:osmotically-inducible protein OsmY